MKQLMGAVGHDVEGPLPCKFFYGCPAPLKPRWSCNLLQLPAAGTAHWAKTDYKKRKKLYWLMPLNWKSDKNESIVNYVLQYISPVTIIPPFCYNSNHSITVLQLFEAKPGFWLYYIWTSPDHALNYTVPIMLVIVPPILSKAGFYVKSMGHTRPTPSEWG